MTDQTPSTQVADSLEPRNTWESLMRSGYFHFAANDDLNTGEKCFVEAAKIARQCHLPVIDLGGSLISIAVVYVNQERYAEAELLLLEALELHREELAPYHETVGVVHELLAVTYQMSHRYDDASKHWTEMIRCFSWMPDYFPKIKIAAEELCYCRGKSVGVPEPLDYRGISWRECA